MGKSYRPYYPDEELLLPPSLRDWLPEGHLAYFVSDVVDNLDLSAMDAVYGEEKRGQPPYDPLMMTKVLVYGYCVGVFSSRRIERRLEEDVAFRVLAAGNHPNFRTISDFRKIHLKTLEGLFEQVLQIALEAGALKIGRVALDGTKLKANASKHKAMSYDRTREGSYFTYVWTAEGWLYVAAVVDLFSRRVVGWSMSAAMTAQLVTDALVMAIWRRGKPDALLHHSDRGSQYTSEQFQKLMSDHGFVCSISRSGNVWDNAAMESFFSSLKTERTARKTYRTRDQAKADVFDYIECFYNPKRRHSTIGYLSPVEFEMQAELA